jgi:thiol-disulfide isomerase/thioredoxin
VVKFFAKYCEPCKRSLPAAQLLHERYPTVTFIAIGEDDTTSVTEEVVKQYGLSFPVVHDSSNVLSGRFRVADLPTTFVVDQAGAIVWVGGPERGEAALETAVTSLL